MIDITRPIEPGMLIYPGNPAVAFQAYRTATNEDSALTQITVGSHTGTHIDAPSHIQAGAPGSAQYPLEQLCGPCLVLDLTGVSTVIQAIDLPSTGDATRLLLKTRNSQGQPEVFDPQFVALAQSAANLVVQRGVRVIGIDAPSIKQKGVNDQVHRVLLEANIIIIESLWLRDVAAGAYELLCLPLPIDLDGAPVRAVLR